tara:strand:- start:1830 stop:1994 length:165 start_codon:yes stop_codon:yes gene_type:complete
VGSWLVVGVGGFIPFQTSFVVQKINSKINRGWLVGCWGWGLHSISNIICSSENK